MEALFYTILFIILIILLFIIYTVIKIEIKDIMNTKGNKFKYILFKKRMYWWYILGIVIGLNFFNIIGFIFDFINQIKLLIGVI